MIEITTSEKLNILLSRRDITKKELAEKLGTSQPNLSKKFKFDDWRESDIKEICKLLNVDVEVVFNIDGETL